MGAEIERRLALQAVGSMVPFTVLDGPAGRVVGMTTYMHMDQVNRRVEIGSTWYARRVQRTGLNTEAELLLLAHAFLAACAWTLTFFGQKVGPLGDRTLLIIRLPRQL
jgi:RimJ/RimL family protein N-acetyltransferase